MEFKLGEKVDYEGGEIIYALDEHRQPKVRNIAPAKGTYIWQVITNATGQPAYIIEHIDGLDIQFFIDYKDHIGNVDVGKLNSNKKYLVLSPRLLKSAEKPITQQPSIHPQGNSENTPQNFHSHSESPTNEDMFEEIQKLPMDISPLIEDEVSTPPSDPIPMVDDIQNSNQSDLGGVGLPHYSINSLPNTMINIVPKIQIMKCMKSPQPFTVENAMGIHKGTAGDYLMVEGDFVSICPKDKFDEHFEIANELIVIEYLGKPYKLLPGIAEYINKLEELNTSLRMELLEQSNKALEK